MGNANELELAVLFERWEMLPESGIIGPEENVNKPDGGGLDPEKLGFSYS